MTPGRASPVWHKNIDPVAGGVFAADYLLTSSVVYLFEFVVFVCTHVLVFEEFLNYVY